MVDMPPPPPSYYEHTVERPIMMVVNRSTVPSNDDLLNCAKDIAHIFDDGFQWTDIGTMVDEAMEFVEAYDGLTFQQKRDNIITIVNYVIDETDTPYLPDRIFDPIFKKTLPAFVDMALNNFQGKLTLRLGSGTFKGKPSDEIMKAFAKQLKDIYGDGFQWEDLGSTVQVCVEFVAAYRELSPVEKKESTIKLLEYFIDITDTPYLPDSLADPIMKKMVPSFVEAIFKVIS